MTAPRPGRDGRLSKEVFVDPNEAALARLRARKPAGVLLRGWGEPAGGASLKARARPPVAPPARFDPAAGRPGFRELGIGGLLLPGPVWLASERAARFAARDLGLGLVSVTWFLDRDGREAGFAHPDHPSRIWVRATPGPTPGEVARNVLHEARHVWHFRGGLGEATGQPDTARRERDAEAYALEALGRFYEQEEPEGVPG